MFRPDPKIKTTRKKQLAYSRPFLIALLDGAYSKWLRLSESKNGKCECFTCGNTWDWKTMECGHFISRKWLSTRWFHMNTRPQCHDCNSHKMGNLGIFERKLKEIYGDAAIEQMKIYSKKEFKISRLDLVSQIEMYRELLKSAA